MCLYGLRFRTENFGVRSTTFAGVGVKGLELVKH